MESRSPGLSLGGHAGVLAGVFLRWRAMVHDSLEQVCAVERHDRNGYKIGGEKRDDHAQSKSCEEKLAHAVKKCHGEKDDYGHDGDRKHRKSHLVNTHFVRGSGFLAKIHDTENVLQ